MCIVTTLNVVKVPRSDTQPKGYVHKKTGFFQPRPFLYYCTARLQHIWCQ